MYYILIENNKIKSLHKGCSLPEGAVEIPEDKIIGLRKGAPINFYKEDWTRKTDYELMQERLKPLDCLYYFDDKGNLKEKTLQMLVDEGLTVIPNGYKIEDDRFIEMSDAEKYKANLMSKAYYSKKQRDKRDKYLAATDKYMIVDFPVDENTKEKIMEYRQTLRDITKDENFPDVEIPFFDF